MAPLMRVSVSVCKCVSLPVFALPSASKYIALVSHSDNWELFQSGNGRRGIVQAGIHASFHLSFFLFKKKRKKKEK